MADVSRGELEALRGLAAFGVVFGHAWAVGHDYASTFGTPLGRLGLMPGEGLALFLALSGYLVTRLLLKPDPELVRYYRHRAARILPSWWFVLACVVLLDQDGVRDRELWRFPLLLQGFWSDTALAINAPSWTLAVEAQYYVLLPLVCIVLRRGRGAALATVAVLTVATAAVHISTVVLGSPTVVWKYSLAANAFYFVPGIVLAVLQRYTSLVRQLLRLPHPRLLLVLLSLPFWFSFVFLPRTGSVSAVGGGLVVAAMALPLGESRSVRLMRARPLVTMGALSFGTYLWHTPVLVVLLDQGIGNWVVLLVLDTAISASLAAVSLVLVERPFLRLRDVPLRSWRTRDPIVLRAAVGTGIAAVASVLALAT